MKKSKLSNVVISGDAIEEALMQIRGMLPFINANYMEYGVEPIQDQITGQVIDFQGLGDPETAKDETMELSILGQKVILPISSSKYIMDTDKGTVDKVTKTLNIDPSDPQGILTIFETAVSIMKLAKFFTDFMEVPLRGLTPELDGTFGISQAIAPLYGKEFLNMWIGNVPGGQFTNPEQQKKLIVSSQVQHIHNGLFRFQLDSKLALYEAAIRIIKAKDNLVVDNTSVVSNVVFNPTINEKPTSVINTTEVTNTNTIFGDKVQNMFDAMTVNNTPTKKK